MFLFFLLLAIARVDHQSFCGRGNALKPPSNSHLYANISTRTARTYDLRDILDTGPPVMSYTRYCRAIVLYAMTWVWT